jgi:chaperonin GroEL
VIVGKIQDNDTYAFGYDAQNGKFENLVSKRIIDPTKVVRTALQDAVLNFGGGPVDTRVAAGASG